MLRMAGMPSFNLLTSGRLCGSDWAEALLMECIGAISNNDLAHAQHLLWVLNELSSPYGSHEQRLAYYFMQALFCKISGTGPHTLISLCAAAERSNSFESMRKTMLKFQEASPWVTFGHVAANGAIMEALEGESSVHIIDLSTTFCTQWPTLLEALATRAEGAPNVRLSTVVFNEAGASSSFASMNVMEEVGIRLEKFARLMGVPFQFSLVNHTELHTLVEQAALGGPQYTDANQMTTEVLAINCISAMHRIAYSQRQALLSKLQSLSPKILTLVEDEAHIGSSGSSFTESFSEALRFYGRFFDMLEGSMGKASGERVTIERGASRRIMRIVGCEEEEVLQEGECTQMEKRERGEQWRERLLHAGFLPKGFSDDAVDDVKALLKRYKEGWGLTPAPLQAHSPSHDHRLDAITLTWKDHAVISASAWRSS